MPSCSTSSNITASINSLSVVQGGSRLMVSIPVSTNPGLTTGNVIRYDVVNGGYTASKADQPASSEVFGVVESYDAISSNYNVVMYGSISLGATYLAAINGSSGASGGNDIYFLSGTTAGLLQNLAPSNLEHIVKPVYQAAPHGSYSGVVINYLGYRIGGDIDASLLDTEIGNLQIAIGNNSFGDGYVDASISQLLPIIDFPEFYSKYNISYGFSEVIEITDPTPISSNVSIGNTVTQPSTNYSGTVEYIDTVSNIIRIKRPKNTTLANPNLTLQINVGNSSLSYSFDTSSVYGVYSPKITLNTGFIQILDNNGSSVNTTSKVGIKVKPQGVKVNIPSTVTVSGLTANQITVGTTNQDVEVVLIDHESRLDALELTLNIS